MKAAPTALVTSLLMGATGVWAGEETKAPRASLRILLTYGGHGFQEKPFFEMFDNLPGIEHTKAELPKWADLLKPGLEKEYDAIVMYDMCLRITPEQQEAFVELLKRGIGVVGLHHNVGAHRDWDEYRKILGGKFIFADCEIDGVEYAKSPWKHGEDIAVKVSDRDHPITKGIENFTIHDESYGKFYVAPDVHVLLTTDHPRCNRELAWTKQYGKSRIAYLMLGHDSEAWKNPNYPKLLERAIRWTSGTSQ